MGVSGLAAVLGAIERAQVGVAAHPFLLLLAANALVALLLWSVASGLFAALDFTLLRVVLPELLHERAAAKVPAAAALHHAAFHMPFNILDGLVSAPILALSEAVGLRANQL